MDLADSKAGNRFDSLTGRFQTLYFGSTLEACFGETLSRFRPDPNLSFVRDEWEDLGFMSHGHVPADWRRRRTSVRALVGDPGSVFLDVEDAGSRAYLERELGTTLSLLGCTDLDVPTIRGHDRRITRAISEWAWQQVDDEKNPVFAGLRYLSRLDTEWECWAVFDRVATTELQRLPILSSNPNLNRVARRFGIVVH